MEKALFAASAALGKDLPSAGWPAVLPPNAPAKLTELWQKSLSGLPKNDLQDFSKPIGEELFHANASAGAIVEASAVAVRVALSALSPSKIGETFELATVVTQRILDATALVIDSWGSAAIDPVKSREWLDAETKELQEHVRLLEEMTLIDPLTKIFNRRHFDRAVDAEIARAQRYGLALCTVMVDVDRFKLINDTYGHLLGDEVLCHVAEVLQAQARKSDIVARYGGEEFVLILTETSFEAAGAVAERMRGALENRPIAFGDGVTIAATASFGYSALAPDDSARSLLERADAALYRAKESGRNRVSD